MLNTLRDAVHSIALAKGWWEAQQATVTDLSTGHGTDVLVPRTFAECLALVHSEVSEALEDHRNGMAPQDVLVEMEAIPGEVPWPITEKPDGPYVREGDRWTALSEQNCARYGWRIKPVGIPIELADVIIRVLDICGRYQIDIEAAVRMKAAYNTQRPHRHGGKKL